MESTASPDSSTGDDADGRARSQRQRGRGIGDCGRPVLAGHYAHSPTIYRELWVNKNHNAAAGQRSRERRICKYRRAMPKEVAARDTLPPSRASTRAMYAFSKLVTISLRA